MPKYYFNTRLGDDVIRDPEGIDLRDPDQAWEVARTTIRELMQEQSEPRQLFAAYLEVTDAAGEIVLEFPFTEALFDPPDETTRAH